MRVLLTTRGSSGHLGPLAPFGHACLRAGHDVLVAAQDLHRANVERVGLPFAPVGAPPPEEWGPLLGDLPRMSFEDANARMIGEFFGGLDVAAALPALRRIVEDWRPDVILREVWEYASTLVADLHGVPLVRVGLGLAAMEERCIGWAAPAVSDARVRLGLPADPDGDRLRESPYLTTVPAALEDPAVPAAPRTKRFRPEGTQAAPAPLPDWWPGSEDPLVYATFGSVTAAPHLPYYPGLYRAALDALAEAPARVLLTVGEPRDLDELGPVPPNVRVEHWVPQEQVAPHAAAIVCHGGHGSTLGALAHGVPLVVLPLFSIDQFVNAAAVAKAGAGVALDDERGHPSGAMEVPTAALGRLREGVERVLGDDAHGREARRIAEEMRGHPPVDAAVAALERIAA